jgi:DNA-binding phage protein
MIIPLYLKSTTNKYNHNMDDKTNDEVGTLLEQLQAVSMNADRVREEKDPLKKDDLEKFVIEKGGTLVEDAMEMIATVKDFIISAPNAEDVGALADLIRSASTAIEALNRITVTDKKSETSIKLKEMDIAAKKEMQQVSSETKLLATREEIFKMLVDKAKPLEAEIIETKSLPN